MDNGRMMNGCERGEERCTLSLTERLNTLKHGMCVVCKFCLGSDDASAGRMCWSGARR